MARLPTDLHDRVGARGRSSPTALFRPAALLTAICASITLAGCGGNNVPPGPTPLAAAKADGPDSGRPDAGEVYVFFGPFSGGETRDAAAEEQSLTIYGANEGDEAGRSLGAGDLNGDEIDDLVIGSPFADGPDRTRLDAGGAHVLYGSPSLPPTIDLAAQGGDTM